MLSMTEPQRPLRAQLSCGTHQTQGEGEEVWEGSREDREAPGKRQAGAWAGSPLVGDGVALVAAVTPP